MTNLTKQLVKTVNEKGWLAISSVCFDNSVVVNIMNSGGYVAFSESENLMFWQSNQDTADSNNILNGFVHQDPTSYGMITTFVAEDLDCLQHFDYAAYGRFDFYWMGQDQVPIPKIPTKEFIMSLKKDEATGLYPGTDILYGFKDRYNSNIGMDGKREPVSVINMYSDDQFTGIPEESHNYKTTMKPFWDYPDYPKGITSTKFASAVKIDAWKAFYDNQEKFAKAMVELTGIADVK